MELLLRVVGHLDVLRSHRSTQEIRIALTIRRLSRRPIQVTDLMGEVRKKEMLVRSRTELDMGRRLDLAGIVQLTINGRAVVCSRPLVRTERNGQLIVGSNGLKIDRQHAEDLDSTLDFRLVASDGKPEPAGMQPVGTKKSLELLALNPGSRSPVQSSRFQLISPLET